MIKKTISIFIFLTCSTILLPSTSFARYCNSSSCSMCNRLFGTISNYSQSYIPTYTMPNNLNVTKITKTAPGKNLYIESTPYVESTPQVVVDAMLKELNLKPNDTLYDLGCGDGRILISAVEQYGCKALGIEINPKVAEFARKNVATAGCGKILIMTGDATKFNLDKATAVTMYLFPPLMEKLMKRIKTDRVVSYSHEIPGKLCKEIIVNKNIDFYKIYLLDEYQYAVPKTEPIPTLIQLPFAPEQALLPPEQALLPQSKP